MDADPPTWPPRGLRVPVEVGLSAAAGDRDFVAAAAAGAAEDDDGLGVADVRRSKSQGSLAAGFDVGLGASTSISTGSKTRGLRVGV